MVDGVRSLYFVCQLTELTRCPSKRPSRPECWYRHMWCINDGW